MDDFEVLRSFRYPDDFQDIKREYQWLQNNFSEYIDLLNQSRKPTDLQKNNDQNETKVDENNEILFPEGFCFCNDPVVSSSQTTKASELKVLLDPNIDIFKGLYLIDDAIVENIIAFFYIQYREDYDKGFISPNHDVADLVKAFCNSPNFEIKLLDFCFFFLYCSKNDIEKIIADKLTFPYSSVLNSSNDGDTPVHVHFEVSFNILEFFETHLGQKEYLLYQPKLLLETYGLKSLQKLKETTNYHTKTMGIVSIADLLVGILEVQDLEKLAHKISPIITSIFSSKKSFEILEMREGEELQDKTRVLTFKSCEILFKSSNIEAILQNIPDILLPSLKTLPKLCESKVDSLSEALAKTNEVLKAKMKDQMDQITDQDIQAIMDKKTDLADLDKVLGSMSSSIQTWLLELKGDSVLNKPAKSINKGEKEKQFIEFFKTLERQVLTDKYFEDLVIHLFEMADYLSKAKLLNSVSISSQIVRVCFHFYSLRHLHEEFTKIHITSHNANDVVFAELCKVASTEVVHEQLEFVELSHTFSHLRSSRQFDFDALFSNMCKSYQDLLIQTIFKTGNKKVMLPEISLICKKLPWVMDFNLKKDLLNEQITADLEEAETQERGLLIDRANLLRTTIPEFSYKPVKELKGKISINFKDEIGQDVGGLTREFFTIINKEIFDPNTGLFRLCENKINLQPSPMAKIIPSHLKFMELAGMMLAKAIQQECLVDVNLTKPFLKHILGRRMVINDLEDIDPDLAKSLNWILGNSVEGLEQTFTYEAQTLIGETVTKELIPNGANTLVTEENKKMFVKSICDMKMRGEIQDEIASFLKGFHCILNPDYLSLFSPAELQILIAGVPSIDIEVLKKNAVYEEFTEESDQIKWLWEVLEEFDQKELAAFFYFISGSVKLNYAGLKKRPLKFTKANYEPEKLPVAHTCFWHLEIPLYRSKEELKHKLVLAIFEGQEGFMLA